MKGFWEGMGGDGRGWEGMGWGLLIKEGRVRGNGNGSICLSWGRGAAEIVVIAHFPTAAIFTRGNKTHSAWFNFSMMATLGRKSA